MTHEENHIAKNRANIKLVFLAWLLTLPFGSNLILFDIGSESTGYFTLYPSLIFAFFLVITTPWVYKSWGLIEKICIVFLSLWLASSFLYQSPFNIKENALFDIRTLIIQLVYIIALINSYHVLKGTDFKSTLVMGLRVFLFVLLIFGIFEFSTGIHFESIKTAEMTKLVIGNHFNAPMFLYGNQNNYLVYILFIFLALTLFDEQIQKNNYLLLLISVIILIFAIYADSNFAKIICQFMIVYFALFILKEKYQTFGLIHSSPYLISIALVFITTLVNPLFFGPKFQDSDQYRLNEISLVEKDSNDLINVVKAREKLSKQDQAKLINYLDSVRTKNPSNSTNIRKNLILNGLDYIIAKPFFGLGPGGYEDKILENNHRYYVNNQLSPHNFPIEIISKYGVFGWIYFFILFWLLVKLFFIKKIRKTYPNKYLMLFLAALPFLWLMPASYLFLDTHKLLLPFLLVFLLDKQDQTKRQNTKQLKEN